MGGDSFRIKYVVGREILDSRGNPTVEADVCAEGGALGRAAAPSGASTGKFEALELRDRDQKRYKGKGVLKAVKNVNSVIAPALRGVDCRSQQLIDAKMLTLDGTKNKAKLGANAVLAVSLATAKCAAYALNIPLYRYLGGARSCRLPIPMMNIINGGKHAGNELALQEFLIMPVGAKTLGESVQCGAEVYQSLKAVLQKSFGPTSINVGDEGGYAPPLKKTADALRVIVEAIEAAGYRPGRDVWLGVDAASSSFYDKDRGIYKVDGTELDRPGLHDYYKRLIQEFDVRSIEDPFYEEDFEGFAELTKAVGGRVQIVGDDLFVTNIDRIRKGIEFSSANALLLKMNQIGSLTESLAAAELVFTQGWRVVASHRSGETEDAFIADLAVSLGGAMIKTGAPARSERTAKYNQLLRIEEELADAAEYWGPKLA